MIRASRAILTMMLHDGSSILFAKLDSQMFICDHFFVVVCFVLFLLC